MGDHFFLLMYATSGEERNVTRFTSYRRVEDAVAMVKEWLEKACCMDCYPAAEEAAADSRKSLRSSPSTRRNSLTARR